MWSPTEMSVARRGHVSRSPRPSSGTTLDLGPASARRCAAPGTQRRHPQHRRADVAQQQRAGRAAMPAHHAEAEGRLDEQQAEGHHGDDASRPRVFMASGRRLFSSSLSPTLTTDLWISRKFDDADAQAAAEAQAAHGGSDQEPPDRRCRRPGRRAWCAGRPGHVGEGERSNISSSAPAAL